MSDHEFKCGPGQRALADQADEMGYFLESQSDHQAMVNRVTSLLSYGVLQNNEAAALYNRIVKKMIPDLKPKSAIIVPYNGIQTIN